MRAIDPKAVHEYTPICDLPDPDSGEGGLPEEQRAVFELRRLTHREMRQVLPKLSSKARSEDEKNIREGLDLATDAVRAAVLNWRNVQDAPPCVRVPDRPLFSASNIDMVAATQIEWMPLQLLQELFAEILRISAMQPSEAKNSWSPAQ